MALLGLHNTTVASGHSISSPMEQGLCLVCLCICHTQGLAHSRCSTNSHCMVNNCLAEKGLMMVEAPFTRLRTISRTMSWFSRGRNDVSRPRRAFGGHQSFSRQETWAWEEGPGHHLFFSVLTLSPVQMAPGRQQNPRSQYR